MCKLQDAIVQDRQTRVNDEPNGTAEAEENNLVCWFADISGSCMPRVNQYLGGLKTPPHSGWNASGGVRPTNEKEEETPTLNAVWSLQIIKKAGGS